MAPLLTRSADPYAEDDEERGDEQAGDKHRLTPQLPAASLTEAPDPLGLTRKRRNG